MKAFCINEIIGSRLQAARKRAGLSQEQLGALVGLDDAVSSARMSRYENAVHEPPIQFMKTVGRVLGVPLAYFYCDDDRLADIILTYYDLSLRNREALWRIVQDYAPKKDPKL